jgi:hypothetical protein
MVVLKSKPPVTLKSPIPESRLKISLAIHNQHCLVILFAPSLGYHNDTVLSPYWQAVAYQLPGMSGQKDPLLP